jgi:hypothetical protein
VKQTIFPTLDTAQPTATIPITTKNSQLKRSRSENDAEEEEYSSVPNLVVTQSFNSFTSEEDWEEPDWLLPKEVVCADVEMKEAN